MNIQQRILDILASGGVYTPEQICRALGLERSDRGMIIRVLKCMEEVVQTGGGFGLPGSAGILEGTVQGSRGDYCFAVPDDRENGEDLYISAANSMGAMHGDRVRYRPLDSVHGERYIPDRQDKNRHAKGRKPPVKSDTRRGGEGEITEILVHANEYIVGELIKQGGRYYVLPDNPRLHRPVHIPSGRLEGAKPQQKVRCRVTVFTSSGALEGEINEVLGYPGDKGVDMLGVIREKGLRDAFPPEVTAQAEKTAAHPPKSDGRRDLRGETVFTVDGEDARDLDDAVSVTREENGWLLGVHIADVSAFVRPGTAVDEEAYLRGTSVYFPDRVLPMLPKALSNGVCSLNQDCDRLTLSVLMHIDESGRVTDREIFPSVIRSVRRCTYEQVNELFSGKSVPFLAPIAHQLFQGRELSLVLESMRRGRGAVDFELPEPEFTLDEQGRAVGLRARERGEANRMIEQFMLQANECVADFMLQKGIPSMYRVHEKPDPQRLEDFNTLIAPFGLSLPEDASAKDCCALLAGVQGTQEEKLVSRMLLRSMKKARYDGENMGHFGLAAAEYLHFTSPIRRYPDLTVHRMLHFFFEGNDAALKKYKKRMQEMAGHCSQCELAAAEAERAADDIKKAEYAQSLVGQCVEGVISGVSASAFWVEMPDTLECIVPLAYLRDDFYNYDAQNCCLTGERSGKRLRMGDAVRVRLLSADPSQGRVEAEPAEEEGGRKKSGAFGQGKKRAGSGRNVKADKPAKAGKPVKKEESANTDAEPDKSREKNKAAQSRGKKASVQDKNGKGEKRKPASGAKTPSENGTARRERDGGRADSPRSGAEKGNGKNPACGKNRAKAKGSAKSAPENAAGKNRTPEGQGRQQEKREKTGRQDKNGQNKSVKPAKSGKAKNSEPAENAAERKPGGQNGEKRGPQASAEGGKTARARHAVRGQSVKREGQSRRNGQPARAEADRREAGGNGKGKNRSAES